MLRMLIAKIALGGAAICAGGGVAGIGLANYVESGSFHFYKQPRIAEWRAPEPSVPASDMLAFSDLAGSSARFGSDVQSDR